MKQLFLGLALLGISVSLAKANDGELIVFTGDPKSPITKDFLERHLPAIQAMAGEQGIHVVEKHILKGTPSEVTFTPAIFFQNHLGRSLFVGRYALIDKIKTFIRTVSRMPQQAVSNEKHDVLVSKRERATVFLPLKITDLAGSIPEGHDGLKFHQTALLALAKGANKFTLQSIYAAQRSDRAMYLALYPYLGADGKFFLSAEIYSQFNCVEPIFKQFDKPYAGLWKNWEAVFEEAGSALQSEIQAQLNGTTRGDGLLPVPLTTPVKSWEELGLSLPKPPSGSSKSSPVTDLQLGAGWTYAGPVDGESPALSFSFQAPLDSYSGEVKNMFGTLALSAGPSLENANGKFGIETASLTMGDPALDAHVHEIIEILAHPQAFFTFEKLNVIEQPMLRFGSLTKFSVRGSLEFMSFKVPIDVTAQMEPFLDEGGASRLTVTAAFSLRLRENFGLKGPDGPEPASDTMQFLLNFLLKPSEQ